MIIILENKIEKLSPAVNRTQTGKIMLCYIVEMFYSIFLCTCADVTDEILKNLMNLNQNLEKKIEKLSPAMNPTQTGTKMF